MNKNGRFLKVMAAMCIAVSMVFGQSGTTGPLTWSISGGTLTISGSGAMPTNFTYYGTNNPWYAQRASITSVVIEDGVTNIGQYAFYEHTGLTSVTIPNSVTSIGERAFSGCSGLTGTLTIPNSVTSIGENAFSYCSGLTGTLTIPNSVTSIGRQAFDGCSKLTSVTIGNSVTSIGDYAFRNCSKLTSVTIPASVTSIGYAAFSGCSELTGTLTIPNSVTTIDYYAFSGCSGLTSVTIPNSVTSIGNNAFRSCRGLKQIINNATTPQTINATANNGAVFDSVNTSSVKLYVPAQSFDAYKAKDGWKSFDIKSTRITTQPDNKSITFGQTAQFSAAADLNGANSLTYQWQVGFVISENFEESTNSFTFVNGSQTNKWVVGTDAAYAGKSSAYISNNENSNAYTVNAASVAHMYRDITFPAFTTCTLSFYWKGQGEGSYDYLSVHLVETSVTPAAGTPLTSTSLGAYRGGGSWQRAAIVIPATNSQTTKRLVFTWRNDASGGTNPPVAVDNIMITTDFANVSNGTGGTTAEYTTPNAIMTMDGYSYRCFVTNNYGHFDVSDYAVLTVNKANNPAAPAGISAVFGHTLADVVLPSGWAWESAPTTSVGNAGTQTHKARFNGDVNYNASDNIYTISVAVAKAKVVKPAVVNKTLVYSGSELSAGIAANAAYTITSGSATNANNYTATVALIDKNNYEWADGTTADFTLDWSIAKKAGTFGDPSALNTTYSPTLTLDNLALPAGYSWNTPTTILSAGNNQSFAATFTDPSGNYTAVSGSIVVNVAKATPEIPAPINVAYYPGLKLSEVLLPAGYAWNTPTTFLTLGENQLFAATFIDWSGNYVATSGYIVVNVLVELPTPLHDKHKHDNRHGILLEKAVVSQPVKIFVKTPEQAQINLAIYDNAGNVLYKTSGRNTDTFVWNLTNAAGRNVANGSYLIVVEAKGVKGSYAYSAKVGVKR